eukprot:Seg325.5 transcript_id=Seg325.5/GoldUCD/mRNA.D3Y31 product="E3 ubiquitin-protein ligase MSL2" protein_id=Seg325.5/GoldUCD/D3Y31
MAALPLYVTVCRNLLESNSHLDDSNDEAWEETARKLRRLRQNLQCRICRQIRSDPFTSNGCNHVICRNCKESKKGLFGGCRHCKNPDELQEDKQTASVMRCYAKVCEILEGHRVAGVTKKCSERIDRIWDLVVEGVVLFENKDAKVEVHPDDSIRHEAAASCSGCSTSNYSQKDDVHLSFVNKAGQDGGFIKDGGSKDGRLLHDDELIKQPLSNDFITESPVIAENTHEVILDTDIENPHGENKEIRTEEKIVPKLFMKKEKNSSHFKLVSKLSDDDLKSNGSDESPKRLENGRRSEHVVNGFIHETHLHEKDVNRTVDKKQGKRKLDLSDETIFRSPDRSKRARHSKNDTDCEPMLANLENGDGCKSDSDDVFHSSQNSSDEITHKHSRRSNSGISKHATYCNDHNEGSEKHSGENGHRKPNLIRKNKYKCSCGTSSSVKYFSDICNHRRCVCFAAGVPCVSCKCRFCSNPHLSRSDGAWATFGFKSDNKTTENNHSADFEVTT